MRPCEGGPKSYRLSAIFYLTTSLINYGAIFMFNYKMFPQNFCLKENNSKINLENP